MVITVEWVLNTAVMIIKITAIIIVTIIVVTMRKAIE